MKNPVQHNAYCYTDKNIFKGFFIHFQQSNRPFLCYYIALIWKFCEYYKFFDSSFSALQSAFTSSSFVAQLVQKRTAR